MRDRLPLVLSVTALLVAVFGSTSLARSAVDAAVPLARRAYLADTAKNALRVDNIKASRTATPGMLLPLDSKGKLPASVGAVGPQGPPGAAGRQGQPGTSGYTVVTATNSLNGNNIGASVSCPSGTQAFGGGGVVLSGTSDFGPFMTDSLPANGGWLVRYTMGAAGNFNLSVEVYAICAKVGS
jgi:hypothetical protein